MTGASLNYIRAVSLDEALRVLEEQGDHVIPLAGGTDIVVDMREGRISKGTLLDISRLEELRRISVGVDCVEIGACVTFSQIMGEEALREAAPVLQEACATIGSVQIRNVATLGGNVANSSPAADSVPALLVHEAKVILASSEGRRKVPLDSFLVGPYRNSRRPNELISGFILERMPEGAHHSFLKVGRRRAMAISRLSLAVILLRDEEGRAEVARFALGSATPVPMRMRSAERMIHGKPLTHDLLWEAAGSVARQMTEAAGVRPSTPYKSKAVQGLFIKALFPLLRKEL
jgi:CO/xanthine dehydrogenase FAD-binding subunit